jgi:hypothetical protein
MRRGGFARPSTTSTETETIPVTKLVRRTARSARRKPLVALLCVLVAIGGGTGAAVAFAASPPSVPPAPVLTAYPPDPNGTATSTFAWTDPQAGVTFLCSVENGKFFPTVTPPGGGSPQPCTSPLTYNVSTTNNGMHQFAVEAVDGLGNVSSITKYQWKVPKTAMPLTIGGSAGTVFPGGASSAFQTTITNPNTGPVTITSLTVTLGAMPSGCQASWFALSQSNVSPSKPITVPGNTTIMLPDPVNAPGVTAPSVSMTDSGDQTSCESATIPVSYDNSYSASFSVGAPTPFTFTIGNASGGPMYPGGGSGTYETETYQVDNPSAGAQNLNQVVISVAHSNGSAWSSPTTNFPLEDACDASDFELSLNGTTWAAAGASVTDTAIASDIPPGGTSATHIVHIRMVDSGDAQDNCQDLANVPLYYSAS